MSIEQKLPFYRDAPGPYSALLQKRDKGESIKSQDLQKARDAISSQGLSNPFVYRVVRKKDMATVGHLVGSLHHCNEEMLLNPIIQKVVCTCSRFFIERLPSWYASIPPSELIGLSLPCDRNEPLSRNGMDISMDITLCMMARSRNIECEGLETAKESTSRGKILEPPSRLLVDDNGNEYLIPTTSDFSSEKKTFNPDNHEVSKGTYKWFMSRTEEERAFEQAEYYQRGASHQLYSFMMNTKAKETLQRGVFKPNALWAKRSIIPAFSKLSKGTNPLCILVGADHLLGSPSASDQTGLLKILRENGYIVTRVNSEKDIQVESIEENDTVSPIADLKPSEKNAGKRPSCSNRCVLVSALIGAVALAAMPFIYFNH